MSHHVTQTPAGRRGSSAGRQHALPRLGARPATSRAACSKRRTARRDVALEREADGYCSARVPGVGAGDRYRYRLDGDARAGSRRRASSRTARSGRRRSSIPRRFAWTDRGVARASTLRGQVIYEMHVGTFTAEGTWRARDRAAAGSWREIGITVLEVMPVAEFPGRFGWGYDGVFPFAPTRLYGTPDDFRAFVDRAHALGLGVILDVVYNHLGPDGCVFGALRRRATSRSGTRTSGAMR